MIRLFSWLIPSFADPAMIGELLSHMNDNVGNSDERNN